MKRIVDSALTSWKASLTRKPLIIRGARQVGKTTAVRHLGQSFEYFIEVKAGKGSTLRSMHAFLREHPETPYGIRFSTQNYSTYEKIQSAPLYAVACHYDENFKKIN